MVCCLNILLNINLLQGPPSANKNPHVNLVNGSETSYELLLQQQQLFLQWQLEWQHKVSPLHLLLNIFIAQHPLFEYIVVNFMLTSM